MTRRRFPFALLLLFTLLAAPLHTQTDRARGGRGTPTPTPQDVSVKKVAIITFSINVCRALDANGKLQIVAPGTPGATCTPQQPTASPTTARTVTFTATNSVAALYRENSFRAWDLAGLARPDGDVYGTYALPDLYTPNTCSYNQWSLAARTRATADGYPSSGTGLDATIYVMPSVGGCPARAWASGRVVWVASGFNQATVAHELGHAFGLRHASSHQCYIVNADKTKTYALPKSYVVIGTSSGCGTSEYGDFALMGATSTYHMNAVQKMALGWLTATTATTRGGEFTIEPLEAKASAVRVLLDPAAPTTSNYLYLELRSPVLLDGALRPPNVGVLMHVGKDVTQATYRSTSPVLVAGQGGAASQWALPVGGVIDIGGGGSVNVVSVAATGAVVRVTAPSTRSTLADVEIGGGMGGPGGRGRGGRGRGGPFGDDPIILD